MTIPQLDHTVCHILDGIVMCYHDHRIAIFPVHLLDQLQDLLRRIIIQGTGGLVTKQVIRIFYNNLGKVFLDC